MGSVLGLALVLWALGAVMKVPQRQRLAMIGALGLLVALALVLLPAEMPLRQSLGDWRSWALLAGVGTLIGGYGLGLGWLRARHKTPETPEADPGAFQPAELDRYARHIMLREVGGPGQRALKDARVLVVGAGGLGSPVLLYLAAAGVGTIGVIDPDAVEASNLQRQVIHMDADIGLPKVHSAAARIKALNPWITVRPYHRAFTEEIAAELIGDYDLVIEGTDSFDVRVLANKATQAAGVPLVSGAIAQWEGHVGVYPGAPAACYTCVFPVAPAPGSAPSCAEAGVIAPLPGVIGAMMAVEAVKVLTGAGAVLSGRMMIYDALYGEVRVLKTTQDPGCPVCGTGENHDKSAA